MPACPHCNFANPEAAAACVRCGKTVAGLSGSAVAMPLPARMTEPIKDVPKAPIEGLQSPGPLSQSLSATSPPAARTSTGPLPETVPNLVDEFPTGEMKHNLGTSPASPGLPGHPMNDAAVSASAPATAPATDVTGSSVPPPAVAPIARPRLVVLRGLKINAEYPIYEGRNTIGRFADRPVDIDLVSQESVEQIWCSRQHAVITFDRGTIAVEDLNSLNGTWVNGNRIHAGQYHPLKNGDVLQIGTVQLKLHVA